MGACSPAVMVSIRFASDRVGTVVRHLAGSRRFVPAATVGKHQRADVDAGGAVDDGTPDREYGVLLVKAPEDMDRDGALGEQCVEQESVRGMDDLFAAKVENHEIVVHR